MRSEPSVSKMYCFLILPTTYTVSPHILLCSVIPFEFFCVYCKWSILVPLLASPYNRCLLAFLITCSKCHYNDSRLSDLQPDAKVNKIKTHQTEVMPNIWNDSPNKKTHIYIVRISITIWRSIRLALSFVIDDLFD